MSSREDAFRDLPTAVLPRGTALYHGTDCDGDFDHPDGPAWFARSHDEAAYWAGWNVPAHGRADGERRVHAFEVRYDVALLDLDRIADDVAGEDWLRLGRLACGADDELGRDEMAAALAAAGSAGWTGHGEVMLTVPTGVLRPVGRAPVEGDNPLRPTPSTYPGRSLS